MSIAYPLPRGTREVTYQAGVGQTVYGPVDFIIWDTADVSVRITAPGADFAATLDASQFTVTPASPATALPASFVVTLDVAPAENATVDIRGLRIPERSTDVTRGGRLQSVSLESELDRFVAVQQEVRRDIDAVHLGDDAVQSAVAAAQLAASQAQGYDTSAAAHDSSAAASAAAALAAALGANSVVASRAALAAASVPANVKAAVCLGYAAAGDCAPFTLKRVTAQPFYGGVRSTDRYLPDGSTDNSNGGWWVYVQGLAGVDALAFGVKADWNGDDASATDNTARLQEAINFAALDFGTGGDTGGGDGNDVVLPNGTIMIASLLIVHTGVRVLGKGTVGTVLKMKDTFSALSHFIRLGTPGDPSAVCASQTKGAAGDLTINGTLASGGVARLLQKRTISIYSAGNDSGRTFTVYGTDQTGASASASVAGTNAGRAEVSHFFVTVTRVAVDGATAGAVTVGFNTVAAFGCRLEQLQLWSGLGNAASGMAMVYTDNAQHTGGLHNVKIFGGNRHCAFFEVGYGGASYFTMQDVETFNWGNLAGVASNNSQIKLNYGGLLSPLSNIVMAANAGTGGDDHVGLEVLGGFVVGTNMHAEGIATAIKIDIPNANGGCVDLRGIMGGNSMDQMIWITAQTDNNSVLCQACYPNGAAITVRHDPSSGAENVALQNILEPTLF